jgi:hypothetical protein
MNRWLTEFGQESLPHLRDRHQPRGVSHRIHDAHPGVPPRKADIHAGLRPMHAAIWRIRRAGLDYWIWPARPPGCGDPALSITVDALGSTQNWQI